MKLHLMRELNWHFRQTGLFGLSHGKFGRAAFFVETQNRPAIRYMKSEKAIKTNLCFVDAMTLKAAIAGAHEVTKYTGKKSCPVVHLDGLNASQLRNLIVDLRTKKIAGVVFADPLNPASKQSLAIEEAVLLAKTVAQGAPFEVGTQSMIPTVERYEQSLAEDISKIAAGADFMVIQPFFDPADGIAYLSSLQRIVGRMPAILPVVLPMEYGDQWTGLQKMKPIGISTSYSRAYEAALHKSDKVFRETTFRFTMLSLKRFYEGCRERGLPMIGAGIDPGLHDDPAEVIEKFNRLRLD